MLRLAEVSQEVWDKKSAQGALQDMLADLTAPPTAACERCGRDLQGMLQLVVADAGQALEACSAERVFRDLQVAQEELTRRTGTDRIQVSRGKRDLFKAGTRGFGRGRWLLSMQHLQRAVLMFTANTIVMVRGRVFELSGVPINWRSRERRVRGYRSRRAGVLLVPERGGARENGVRVWRASCPERDFAATLRGRSGGRLPAVLPTTRVSIHGRGVRCRAVGGVGAWSGSLRF